MKDEITKEVLQRVDTFGNKIDTVLSSLAEKMGVGVDYFWPIFVKQQMLEGWSALIIMSVFIIISILFFSIVIKYRSNIKDIDIGFLVVCVVLSAACFLIALLVSAANLSTVLGQIFNPEYSAIKEVIGMVRGL